MKNIFIPWAKPDVGKDELKEIKNSFKKNWLTQGPKLENLSLVWLSFVMSHTQ